MIIGLSRRSVGIKIFLDGSRFVGKLFRIVGNVFFQPCSLGGEFFCGNVPNRPTHRTNILIAHSKIASFAKSRNGNNLRIRPASNVVELRESLLLTHYICFLLKKTDTTLARKFSSFSSGPKTSGFSFMV